jgi:hypothetical protein
LDLRETKWWEALENCIIKSSIGYTLQEILKDDEMGEACGVHGAYDKGTQNFGWTSLRDHSEDQGVGGIIVDLMEI